MTPEQIAKNHELLLSQLMKYAQDGRIGSSDIAVVEYLYQISYQLAKLNEKIDTLTIAISPQLITLNEKINILTIAVAPGNRSEP